MTNWLIYSYMLNGAQAYPPDSPELQELNDKLRQSLLFFGVCWRSIDFAIYMHKHPPAEKLKYSGHLFLFPSSSRFDSFIVDEKARREIKRQLAYQTMTNLISHFDYYLRKLLIKHKIINESDPVSNHLKYLIKKLAEANSISAKEVEKMLPGYNDIFFAYNNRHKIIHNDAKIDDKFICDMAGIAHAYKKGDTIKSNLFFIPNLSQNIRGFAKGLEGLLNNQALKL